LIGELNPHGGFTDPVSNNRPFANSNYVIQDADFRTCTQILKPISAIAFGEKEADYPRRLCCTASSAARRTWNNLSVKICEDLRPIMF